jgi:hypothetical protein
MIKINEYGAECDKCKKWINPYIGYDVLTIYLCKECFDTSIFKLVEHFKKIMEIK